MFVINTIDVEVRDVTDSAMIVAIRQTVQHTFSHLVGAWSVRVSASDECGRWDLHIRGGFGHHVARFLAVPDRLAERVERRLRAFLQEVVPPFSVMPRRPLLVNLRRSGRSVATSIQTSRRVTHDAEQRPVTGLPAARAVPHSAPCSSHPACALSASVGISRGAGLAFNRSRAGSVFPRSPGPDRLRLACPPLRAPAAPSAPRGPSS
jgi:hypothetical protein